MKTKPLLASALGACILLSAGAWIAAAAEASGLERFRAQRIDWKRCPARAVAPPAQCARLTVPLDHAKPGGRTIELAISRIPARDRARRLGILLSNPGGPGGPGLGFTAELRRVMGGVADRYDLIGFDPRFVGRSTTVDCGPVEGYWQVSAGLSRGDFDRVAGRAADLARRCFARPGNAALLPHASTRNVARDMDLIRAALGERKLSYYGVSYGADLGAVYVQMFGRRADRVVLDSGSDPDVGEYRKQQLAGAVSERALDQWAAWAAGHAERYRLGDTPAEVRGTVTRLIQRAASRPIAIGGRRVDHHVLPLVLTVMLDNEDSDAVLARALRDLVDAAGGKSVRPARPLATWLGLLLDPHERAIDRQVAGQLAVFCADGGWPRDAEAYWREIERVRGSEPIFGPLQSTIAPCAFWPAEPLEPPTRIGSSAPVLIVHATGDKNTPYAGGVKLHRRLAGSRLVSVGIRAHGVYTRRAEGLAPSACAERAVNRYLGTGVRPGKDLACR